MPLRAPAIRIVDVWTDVPNLAPCVDCGRMTAQRITLKPDALPGWPTEPYTLAHCADCQR